MSTKPVAELIQLAQQGDAEAIGQLLEQYRGYLRVLALRRMDQRLNARVDASDCVQVTFLEAQRDIDKFRGSSEGEFVAWLKQMMKNNVAEAIEKHLGAQKRSAKREKSMDDTGGRGVAMRPSLASDQSTPSQRVMRGEDAVKLSQALDALSEDQREAVRLRHLEGWSLKEIAERLERSEVAVAGLIKRGLKALRAKLKTDKQE